MSVKELPPPSTPARIVSILDLHLVVLGIGRWVLGGFASRSRRGEGAGVRMCQWETTSGRPPLRDGFIKANGQVRPYQS